MNEYILNIFSEENNFITSFSVKAKDVDHIVDALRPHTALFGNPGEDGSNIINVRPFPGLKMTDEALENLFTATLQSSPQIQVVNEEVSFGYGPFSITTTPGENFPKPAPYKLRFEKAICSVAEDDHGIIVTITAGTNKEMDSHLYGLSNMFNLANEEFRTRPWCDDEEAIKGPVGEPGLSKADVMPPSEVVADGVEQPTPFFGDAITLVNKALEAKKGKGDKETLEEEVNKYVVNFFSESREDGVSLVMDMTKANGERMLSEGFVSAMLVDFPQATIIPEKHGIYCQSTNGYIRKVRALLEDMGIEAISIVPVSTSTLLDTKVIYLV